MIKRNIALIVILSTYCAVSAMDIRLNGTLPEAITLAEHPNNYNALVADIVTTILLDTERGEASDREPFALDDDGDLIINTRRREYRAADGLLPRNQLEAAVNRLLNNQLAAQVIGH